ncbi:MAG TPA: hypothetical protein VF399_07695 [bacterium]
MNNLSEPSETENHQLPDIITFLEDYNDFAVKARPFIINVIAERHRQTADVDEKKLLHTLALEQFGFLIETLNGFFVAASTKGAIDLYGILDKSQTTLIQRIQQIDNAQFFNALTHNLRDAPREILNEIKIHFEEMTEFMRSNADANKYIEEFTAKLRHKFLVYRGDDDDVHALLSPECEKAYSQKDFIKALPQSTEGWKEDMDWMVRRADAIEKFICSLIDTIIYRLKEKEEKKD